MRITGRRGLSFYRRRVKVSTDALREIFSYIFGIIAAQLLVITKSILPSMIYHFCFDFVNHITRLDGLALFIASAVQVCIMLFYILWLDRQIKDKDE